MKLKDFFDLIRVGNCLMAAIATAIGYYLVTLETSFVLGIAMLATFLICAGGQAINDVYDSEIDKKSKKQRPISSGKISREIGYKIAIVLFGIGIIISFFLTQIAFAIAIISSVMLFAYASKMYKTKYIGNFVVATGTALPFIFGAASISETIPLLVIILSLSAFFANLGREVTKDFEDIKKDKGFKKTLPMINLSIARTMIVVYYFIAIFLGVYAYFVFDLGTGYLIITIMAAFVFLYTVVLSEKKNYAKSQSTSKKGMFISLIAFIAAILRI
jgi:geranylgeranylglycerol-phosphate geranylgeranyltransferase